MTEDEQAREVGRMVLEYGELRARGVTSSERIRRFALGLAAMAQRLEGAGPAHLVEPVSILTADEIQLLQSYTEINDLLAEAAAGSRRYYELRHKLGAFGVQ